MDDQLLYSSADDLVNARTRSRCARRPEFHTHSQEPALRVKSARSDGYLHRNRRRYCNDHCRRVATREARHQNQSYASAARRIAEQTLTYAGSQCRSGRITAYSEVTSCLTTRNWLTPSREISTESLRLLFTDIVQVDVSNRLFGQIVAKKVNYLVILQQQGVITSLLPALPHDYSPASWTPAPERITVGGKATFV